MSSNKRYLSCAETAKLLRKALAKEFPGIKFYVRSDVYSGGASIDVYWQDGPSEKEARRVAWCYAGADFDGMIDLKTYWYHWLLPDGTVELAKGPGTTGSHGIIYPQDHPKPHPEAELVSLGADFVHVHRACSKALVERVAEKVHEETGWNVPEIHVGRWWVHGKPREEEDCGFDTSDFQKVPGTNTQLLCDYYNRELWEYSDYEKEEKANG